MNMAWQNNVIAWLIVAFALFCYQRLWAEYFTLWRSSKQGTYHAPKSRWLMPRLISALPLMGLLGTIVGLQGCFSALSTDGVDSEYVTQHIADALLTTQLGLWCAIPAWLMNAGLVFLQTRAQQQWQK